MGQGANPLAKTKTHPSGLAKPRSPTSAARQIRETSCGLLTMQIEEAVGATNTTTKTNRNARPRKMRKNPYSQENRTSRRRPSSVAQKTDRSKCIIPREGFQLGKSRIRPVGLKPLRTETEKCARARWSKERAFSARLTYPTKAPRPRCPPKGPKQIYDTS